MTIERIHVGNLTFLMFEPSMLSLYVDSLGGSTAKPHRYTEALATTGADAVMDGPMFHEPSSYSTYTSGQLHFRHFDLRTGVNVGSSYPSQGMTISVLPNGSVRVANGDSVDPEARVAIQLYPALVRDGHPVTVQPGTISARAALAVMADGRMAFVVSSPMLMTAFVRSLVTAGVMNAGYTDGGGSTSLADSAGTYAGSSEHRRVLSWLFAKASETGNSARGLAVSTKNAVVANPGTTVAVIGLLLLAAGGVYVYRNRR